MAWMCVCSYPARVTYALRNGRRVPRTPVCWPPACASIEYLPLVLHAKTIVVDDEWTMVGTANLDYRSLFVNYELNLVTRDPDLSSMLER